MDEPIIIRGTRYIVCPLTLALVRYLVEQKADLTGFGQFVIDYNADGFVPRHTTIEPKVKVPPPKQS